MECAIYATIVVQFRREKKQFLFFPVFVYVVY